MHDCALPRKFAVTLQHPPAATAGHDCAPELPWCPLAQEELKPLLVSATGFEWVSSARPGATRGKWGCQAQTPGSTLQIRVALPWQAARSLRMPAVRAALMLGDRGAQAVIVVATLSNCLAR